MEPIFACPVCKGRIAFWVLRQKFSCHHCKTVLGADVRPAMNRAAGVGVAIEILFLGALCLWLADFQRAFSVWLAAGVFLGFFGGVLAFKYFLRLSILARPSSADKRA